MYFWAARAQLKLPLACVASTVSQSSSDILCRGASRLIPALDIDAPEALLRYLEYLGNLVPTGDVSLNRQGLPSLLLEAVSDILGICKVNITGNNPGAFLGQSEGNRLPDAATGASNNSNLIL